KRFAIASKSLSTKLFSSPRADASSAGSTGGSPTRSRYTDATRSAASNFTRNDASDFSYLQRTSTTRKPLSVRWRTELIDRNRPSSESACRFTSAIVEGGSVVLIASLKQFDAAS